MAYAVEVRRTHLDAEVAVYAWTMTTGSSGHIQVNRETGILRPCDTEGNPIGSMSLDRHVGNVEDPDPSLKGEFLIVAASILKKWRDDEPPTTAHRYFG